MLTKSVNHFKTMTRTGKRLVKSYILSTAIYNMPRKHANNLHLVKSKILRYGRHLPNPKPSPQN